MDESGVTQFEWLTATVRKKRSQMLRQPRKGMALFPERRDQSPLTPLSDDVGRISSDESSGDADTGQKMFNLNQCISRGSAATRVDQDYTVNKIMEDRQLGTFRDSVGNDSKLKKVKLKAGGVTHTIQTKTSSHGVCGIGLSTTSGRPLDASRPRQKLAPQRTSEEGSLSDKKSELQGILQKDLPRGTFNAGKDNMRKMPMKNASGKMIDKSGPIRKSKRVPKRRISDEDDEDNEIRFLEKLKTLKVAGFKDFEGESTKKRSISLVCKVSKYEKAEDVGTSGKDTQGSEDTDYEEEELLSDGQPEGKRQHRKRKESSDFPIEMTTEISLTTRQRALLSSKDSSASSKNQIELPNGLPPAPRRKPKEKLSEVEQQLKKAEAAQRRKMQNEKAARESEAEAIRKILCQDSNRKKREDKIKKRQEELAQEKATKEKMLASNTIRVVMGPAGNVVIFPQDTGLPHIFDSRHCSYPPPRELCSGPSCVNPYKYRDSKSRLPLCSLQCYKAIHENMQAY